MGKRGFTLVELMVVMAIIAVLSTLIIAAIQAARHGSEETVHRNNQRSVEAAAEALFMKNGTYCVEGTTYSCPTVNTCYSLKEIGDIAGITLKPTACEGKKITLTGACPATRLDVPTDGGGVALYFPGTKKFNILALNYNCSGNLTKDAYTINY